MRASRARPRDSSRELFAALARLARLPPRVGQLLLSAAKRSRSQDPVHWNTLP